MAITHLPDNHRRVLAVTARIVEQALDEIEALLLRTSNRRLTERIEHTYSETERRRLLDTVAKMKEATAGMFTALHLEPAHYTEDQIIAAKRTRLWTVLVDSKSKGTKGFGKLSAEQARLLDFHIDKLLELLKEIE